MRPITSYVYPLLLAIFVASVAADHIQVQNDLAPGTNLTIHCKGKAGDNIVKNLEVGEFERWEFQITWLGTTLYSCTLRWDNHFNTVVVYAITRDLSKCDDCWWSIKPDGAYFRRQFNETMGYAPTWEKLYSWG